MTKYIVETRSIKDKEYKRNEFSSKGKADIYLGKWIMDDFQKHKSITPYRVTEIVDGDERIILESCWGEDENE